MIMKALMKTNLIERYDKAMPGELDACDEDGKRCIIDLLTSIEGKEVDLVFTAGDAFEKADNNVWLPNDLWDGIE